MTKWEKHVGEITPERASSDALRLMVRFLKLGEPRFTEADRDAMAASCEEIAEMCAQMDAGQRGSGKSFDYTCWAFMRLAVAGMALYRTGKLYEIEVDDG